MQTNIAILKTWTFNILEEMCFLLPTEPEDTLYNPREGITVKIQAGNFFTVYLTFAKALSHEIASNSLGLPAEEISEELVHSSIKEMANIIAGNFMNATNLPAVAHLSIPKILDGGPPTIKADAGESYESETCFINNHPLHLTLIENEA